MDEFEETAHMCMEAVMGDMPAELEVQLEKLDKNDLQTLMNHADALRKAARVAWKKALMNEVHN